MDIIRKAKNLQNEIGNKIGLEMRGETLLLSMINTNNKVLQRLIGDKILTESTILVVEPHNKFFDFIDQKIQLMLEGGIFYEHVNMRERFGMQKFEFIESFKILTFDELEAGFVICFVPLVLTIAMFCLEWMIVFKDFIIFRCIFDKFFKINQNLSYENLISLASKVKARENEQKNRAVSETLELKLLDENYCLLESAAE